MFGYGVAFTRLLRWGRCASCHGIQFSIEAILACHQAQSTCSLGRVASSCELNVRGRWLLLSQNVVVADCPFSVVQLIQTLEQGGEKVYWLTRANCRRAEKYGDIR